VSINTKLKNVCTKEVKMAMKHKVGAKSYTKILLPLMGELMGP
jgi:hypothetical protein